MRIRNECFVNVDMVSTWPNPVKRATPQRLTMSVCKVRTNWHAAIPNVEQSSHKESRRKIKSTHNSVRPLDCETENSPCVRCVRCVSARCVQYWEPRTRSMKMKAGTVLPSAGKISRDRPIRSIVWRAESPEPGEGKNRNGHMQQIQLFVVVN